MEYQPGVFMNPCVAKQMCFAQAGAFSGMWFLSYLWIMTVNP